MASRAFAADEVPRDFDAEEAMRAELEALGEDVCASEEERFAEDGAFSSLENARGAAGDPARSPPYGRAWGWDRDPVEDVQRAWKRREARLRRNSARFKVDDECSPDAPRDVTERFRIMGDNGLAQFWARQWERSTSVNVESGVYDARDAYLTMSEEQYDAHDEFGYDQVRPSHTGPHTTAFAW